MITLPTLAELSGGCDEKSTMDTDCNGMFCAGAVSVGAFAAGACSPGVAGSVVVRIESMSLDPSPLPKTLVAPPRSAR